MRIATILGSVLAAGVYAALLFAGDVTSYRVGEFVGRVIMTLLFALVLGKVLSLLAQKSKLVGQVGFLAGIGWAVIGTLVVAALQAKEQAPKTFDGVQTRMSDYHKDLEAHLKDPEYVPEPDRKEYIASIQEEIESIDTSSNSVDAQLRRLLTELSADAAEKALAWEDITQRVGQAAMWDFSAIGEREQLDARLALIDEYATFVRDYKAWYDGRVPEIERHPIVLKMSPMERSQFLKGLLAKIEQLEEPMEDFFAAHRENSEHLRAVMELMAEQLGSWRIRDSDGLIEFDDDEAAANYERILEAAITAEEKVNAASMEIAKRQQVRPL